MKVHVDNVDPASRSGPNSFAFRLTTELVKRGHTVALDSGKDADVSLIFIEPSGRQLAKRTVQRLDGIWFAPDEFHHKNSNIKQIYHQADHVIWQSQFDRNMTTTWWGSPREGSVVSNGASNSYKKFDAVEAQMGLLREKHEKIFVCSANWHPQKRLKDNIRLFRHLKTHYPTACLIVMGSNGHNGGESDVYVVGNQPHDVCMQVFEASDWMLHLAWLDHCPNTVVESLSVGTPVICTEDGGTREIVGDYGIVLREDVKYNYELKDYDSPPPIDVTQVGILPSKNDLGDHPDLSIETSASNYIRIFEDLLKKIP